jgi:hypothetical protein
MKDLALLVADKNMDFALRGILSRTKALGTRSVTYEIRQHVNRDGGVRTTGPETLALLRKQFHHGIVMLDWEGSGTKARNAIALEQELDSRLARMWGDRAKAIVIEPELDVWIWGSENALIKILEWSEDLGIREWLAGRGYTFDSSQKPVRPKEALNELMVWLNQPRSSILYEKITGKISLAQCVDPAFKRLRTTLQSWFAPS